jgi:hypothetical protein
MSADPEKRLAAAHAKVTETDAAVIAAVKAETAARALLANAENELARHQRRNKEKASERAGKLMAALKLGGSAPAFKKKGVDRAADHIAVLEAQDQRDAARIAVDTLSAEHSAATVAHDAAIAQLHATARDILADEAAALASKIGTLDAESMRHRIAIEGIARSNAMGWQRESGLADEVRAVLHGNTLTEIGTKNHALWRSANVEAERVRQLHAARLSQVPAPASAVPAPASA